MSALISAMLDRELPLRTRLRKRLHFLYRRYCRRVRDHFATIQRAGALLNTAETLGAEVSLALAEKEKLRRALKRPS